jgi:hypothetical protein
MSWFYGNYLFNHHNNIMGGKLKIIKDYYKLDVGIQQLIQKSYPYGYSKYLILFRDRNGKLNYGLPFETNEMVYLVRMPKQEAEEKPNLPKLDADENLQSITGKEE